MAKPQVVHQPPQGVALSDLLTIKGREAAHRWLCDELGLPLRLNYVRAAVAKGEMPSVKKGEVHYFSTRGLFQWALKFSEVVL
ncbi:hypothetical protein [Mycobacterium attenuatum]|uniref:hypothetical protein n=1 Tax=Mycobacterium attenuatum TaxID=2341086 RepID=UPI000F2BF66A|nr:hypothetical protein [Mycobacterium attenuatum]VBA47115.1 hypothetical protein LAUMK41_00483 [Mycobacterium attenuatum]